MTDLEANLFAFYIGGAANDLLIAGRFFPRGELFANIEDKIQIAARRFGFKVKSKAKPVAVVFVDHMIERGAWSTKHGDFGATMHQFQPDIYRSELKAMQDADLIVQEAKDAGDTFWLERFASLTSV